VSEVFKIGDYVKTPNYGNGEVVDIETLRKGWSDIWYTNGEAGRYGIKLDDPSLWACSKIGEGYAYFHPHELCITNRLTYA